MSIFWLFCKNNFLDKIIVCRANDTSHCQIFHNSGCGMHVENNIHQSIFLTPANFEKKTKYINRFNPSVAYTIHQADMLGNLVTACL